jgi:hypothetical protein
MEPDLFWALPGPRRYLDGIVERVAQRSSVLIEEPAGCGPVDLVTAAEDSFPTSWRFRQVDGARLDAHTSLSPRETLIGLLRLAGMPDPADLTQAIGPLAEEALRGWLLWVDLRACKDVHVTDGVLALIAEIAGALKNRPSDRPTFVVQMSADFMPAVAIPTEMIRAPWRGVVDRIDTTLYVHERSVRLRPASAPALDGGIVELAGYDLRLAEILLAEWHGELAELPSLFESVRDGYGWQACAPPTDLNLGEIEAHEDLAQWAAGRLEIWPARRQCRHSALLPATGIMSIEHRLIAGQMRTLFPEIEARRADLALWAEREGILAHAHELDLANCETKQLSAALARYARMNYPNEVDRAVRLEGARNWVAHRRLMPTSEADEMFGG